MPTIEEFLADDGDRFIAVGDLQVIKERLSRLRAEGAADEEVRTIEELMPKIENTLLLLLRLVEEQLNS